MCISDWRIGRLIRSYATAYNTTGPVNTTFPANPCRVGLLISPNVIVLSTTQAHIVTFTNGTVLIVNNATMPLFITMANHGDLCTYGFTITPIGVATTGTVTEFSLPDSVLAAGLEEFKREYKW